MSIAGPIIKEQEREISHLKSLIKECQAVLEFYGDEKNYDVGEKYLGQAQAGNHVYLDLSTVDSEYGTKAREMLGKLKGVGE